MLAGVIAAVGLFFQQQIDPQQGHIVGAILVLMVKRRTKGGSGAVPPYATGLMGLTEAEVDDTLQVSLLAQSIEFRKSV